MSAPSPVTSPVRQALSAPRRGVVGFFRGLGFVFRGAKLVFLEQPGLARYWIVPIVVTALSLVGSLGLVVAYYDELAGAIWSDPTGEGWLAVLARAAHWVFVAAVALFLALAALIATILVGSVVAAPFNARLGEVLDERVTGHPAPAFALGRVLADVGRTLVIETTFFVVNVVLFVTSLALPAVAPALGIVGLVLASYYFAIAYLEIPQVARARTLGDRLRFVGAHPMAVLGFGTGVGLFLFVPLLNLLFMPAAVAGGVLLYTELTGAGAPGGAAPPAPTPIP